MIRIICHTTTPSKGMSRWWWQPSSWLSWLWSVLRGHFFWVRVITLWSSRQDIFSGETNYISPVSPEHTAGSLHLMTVKLFHLQWFLGLSCLYPYQISRKCWRQISSPVMSIKIYFLLPSWLLLPCNHKLLNWNMRFLSFSETRDIRPKLPIHQELCRRIPIGKWSWAVR